MPKIDLSKAPKGSGTRYPRPFDEPCRKRQWLKLGDAAGLTQFGVNLVRLEPGVWSSQRHWHTHEDELVYLLEGEAVLVTDEGEETLVPGDCAGFRAGVRNGHCLQNAAPRATWSSWLSDRATTPTAASTPTSISCSSRADTRAAAEYTTKDGTAY